MVQTRRAATDAARGQSTRSGRVPSRRVEAQLAPAFGDRDVRLRSTATGARTREARRRLMDEDEAAGRASGNLCAFTGPNSAEYNTGKRPWAFSKRKVGLAANTLCQPGVREAWDDPAHIAEERRVCGDRNWVYGYKRGDKRVKAHCRKLSGPQKQSMEVAMAKQTVRKKERELAALIRKRNNTNSMSTIAKLEKQIKALRTELKPPREPVMEEPDDISQYDFTSVRPKKGDDSPRTPPGRRAPPRRRKATARTPGVVTATMQSYIDTLPRGERAKAKRTMTAYINFGSMDSTDAIKRYKQRRKDDNREGVDNAGDFEDELDTDDDSDDDGPSGGALQPNMAAILADPQWAQANPALAARLQARDGATGLTRGAEIAARIAALGGDANARVQEAAERNQITAAANARAQQAAQQAAQAEAAAAWARLAAEEAEIQGVPGSESDSSDSDEDRRDSLMPFGSPSAAPTHAQQFAAAQLPGVDIAQDETHAWVGNPDNAHYFSDATSEQSGSGERSHVTHTII
jgi:hypothetical protein